MISDKTSNLLSGNLLAVIIMSLLATTVSADGIRVHRAAQFKKDEQTEYRSRHPSSHQRYHRNLARAKHKHNLRYHSSNANRAPSTPDSRFPNTYREQSNYQKQQSQNFQHGHDR